MTDPKVLAGIKEYLNKTGIFLERKIHTALDRHPQFVSRREYPYSSMNIVNETIPQVFEGTIDVFAVAKITNNTSLCMCIECKKSDPREKHWVFEVRTTGEEIYPFVYYDTNQNALNYEKNIFFPSLGYDGMKFFDKAIQTFQFNENTGSLSRTQSEMAYNSLKQANQALKAFAPAHKEIFKFLNSDPTNILFLPVVVTTANLLIADYKPEDVSWETGEVEGDKIELKSKDWVHYEFPLPVSLKVAGRGGLEFEKRPSFVVKADKFADFIEGLLKDIPRYILNWE